MNNRHFTFQLNLIVLFGILLFSENITGQELMADSKDLSTASATSSTTFVDLDSIILGNLSGAKSVMVLSNIEMQTPAGTAKDVIGYYTLTDGTTSSAEISRYVVGKDYNDRGLAAVCNIFEYTGGYTGSKTFKIQHRRTVPGQSKEIASKSNMVAIVFDDDKVTLPNKIATASSESNSTSTFSPVATTETLTLSGEGGIYLSTAFSTNGEGVTGEWEIQSKFGNGSWTTISGSTISRTNTANDGAATITSLIENQSAGDYQFRINHRIKTGSGTLNTINLTFIAVGLTDENGKIYPSYKNSGLSGGPITKSTPTEIAGPEITSKNASNSLFAHCTFNATNNDEANLNIADFKLGISNSTFTPAVFSRFIEGNDTGSGGLLGIATGINFNSSSTVSLYHNSDGTQSLTTDNVTIVGFQLKSLPITSAADGAWNTTSTWTGGSIPTLNDNVEIDHALTIAEGASSNCSDLLVDSGTLTINSDATSNGSLVVAGTSTGDITYNRYMTYDKWHLVAAPVGGQTIANFVSVNTGYLATNDSKYGLAPYNNATPGWSHYTTSNTAGSFTAGKGYETMRKTEDGTFAFTGTVATSDVSIGITAPDSPGNPWNLVGNPYPSAICANAPALADNNFLTVNTDDLESSYVALYVYDAASSSYLTVNHTYNSNSAFYLAPGQAFFVRSRSGGSTLDFKENMQTHQTGDIFKSGTITIPTIKLIAEGEEGASSTNIKYIEGQTKGLDPGYDAGRFSGGDNSFAVYTHLVGGNENKIDFDIQCLPADGYDYIIPVGINAPENSEVVFRADTENLPVGVPVYLEDKLTGTFISLQEPGSFYTVHFTGQSKGAGRFYLHTKSATTGISLLDKESAFSIIPRPNNNSIRIIGNADNTTQIAIYDVWGRQLINGVLLNPQTNDVDMTGLKNGVYIVAIGSSTQHVSKRISWVK